MVTDRLSTTGLLMVVAAEVPTLFYPCVGLVMLDIASHWVHVHASSLGPGGKKSHKDVADSRYFLLRLYYSNRAFMGVCCVSCEVLYLAIHAATAAPGGVGGVLGIPKSILPIVGKSVSINLQSMPSWMGMGSVGGAWPRTLSLGAFDTVAKQLCVAALPGFAMKQFANWCQLMGSSRALAAYEFEREEEEKAGGAEGEDEAVAAGGKKRR
jgi:CDP-diacylglycerol--inositol 3-phosphatidyltransferase